MNSLYLPIVLHIIKPELRGNHCYWEVKAIHNIALVMDITTLLTDIWIYVESYVPLISPNEDETGLALLITSRESNSSSYNQARITRKYIYIYIYIWYDMIWYDMIWYDMIWYDICGWTVGVYSWIVNCDTLW